MIETITLGEAITIAGVIFSAGSIYFQVRALDKKVDRLGDSMASHERHDQKVHQGQGERLASLEARIS